MAAAGTPIQRGIQLSKVSPKFLHANSTSHTWAFSAFAELIDNAYDPDVSASELLIDKLEINGHTCLIFLDNGAGMDTDKLLKMLSFGFCDKDVYERSASHLPIGHYGNGFKSGSMRLAKDALVFTRCHNSASIGFLSQTYLKAIEADSVFIPIVTYRLPKLERIKSEQSRNNLNAILKNSVFCTEQDLKEELYALEGSMTGTKIILSNLRRLQDGKLELDFSSDETDILCPEAHEVDLTSVYHRPVQLPTSDYKHCLREYCSILFLRPRMKITIRGKRVKSRLISKSLSNTETDSYKPTWLSQPLKITFGFTCQKTKTEDYGMMLYHRNRLIKAFEKVGYQKQPNDLGIGVVGVAQVDFLQPTHNKQDFNKDEKFNSVMMAFANKLNDYWNEKKQCTPTSLMQESLRAAPDWTWAQCDICLKWRRLPDGFDKDSLPEQWFCRFNPDATHNRCEIPEEPEDEDQAVKSSYVKTFKRKRKEKKRLEMFSKQKQDVKPLSEGLPVVSDLQRVLAEAKQRDEEQKRFIMKIQEDKRRIEAQLAESLKLSKPKRKNQTVMAEYPENSNTMASFSKRKGDNQADSSRSTKIRRVNEKIEHSSSNDPPFTNGISEKNSNNCTASRSCTSTSSSSPLKVKIGGLIKKTNKLDQKDYSNKKEKNASSPSISKNNETFVDLTEDIDYEITVNEDYDSEEDIKPCFNDLNAAIEEEKRRQSNNVDVKPDKNVLDHKSKEKSVVSDKEPRPAVGETFTDIKKELPEKEAIVTASKDIPATISSDDNPHAAFDDNDGVLLQTPAECEDNELPSENILSSNVNIVMAALENKLNKSLSNENETLDNSESAKQCINEESVGENDASKDRCTRSSNPDQIVKEHDNDTAVKEPEHVEKNSDAVGKKTLKDQDKDMIEVCSDDDNDFDFSGVSSKKEVVEEEAFQSELHKVNKSDTESEMVQRNLKVVSNVGDGDNIEAHLNEMDRSFGCGEESAVLTPCNNSEMVQRAGSDCDKCAKNSEIKETSTSALKSDNGNSVKNNDSCTKNVKEGYKKAKGYGDEKSVDHNNSNIEISNLPVDRSNNGDCDCVTMPTKEGTAQRVLAEVEMSEGKIGGGDAEKRTETSHCNVDIISQNSCDSVQLEEETVNNQKNDVECENEISYENKESQSKLHSREKMRGKDAPNQSHPNEETHCDESKINGGKDCKRNSPADTCQEKDKCDFSDNQNCTSNCDKFLKNNSEESLSQDHSDEVERNREIVSEQRFHDFLNNVHRLLSFLCPDAHLGDVNDIEQTVRAMIQIHMEGSQSQGL